MRAAAPATITATLTGIHRDTIMRHPLRIRTSHVERGNLTIRTFMKRFARLSLGFSKKVENLTAAVALHVGYYDLCRFHSAIRSTPAMAAGVTDHIWEVEELLDEAGALL